MIADCCESDRGGLAPRLLALRSLRDSAFGGPFSARFASEVSRGIGDRSAVVASRSRFACPFSVPLLAALRRTPEGTGVLIPLTDFGAKQ